MAHQKGTVPDTTYKFLLSGLSGHWDPPALEPARLLVGDGVDWKLWSDLLQGQRVAPLLYETLRGLHLLPLEVEQSLRQVYLWTAMRNGLLLDELGMVLERLQTVGVSVMPVKGATLAETVYSSSAVRPMADLDLLVTPADVNAACVTLTGLGYAVNSLEPWPDYARRYRQVLEFRRTAEGDLYFLIDLHWGVVDVPYYERIPIKTWFERAERAQLGGVESQVPTPEDHLLCLCGHLALHERYSDDLLRYCDLAAIIYHTGETLSWGKVIQQAADWQLVIPLQRALLWLEDLWPGTVPAVVGREVVGLQPSSMEKQIHRWVVDRQRNPTSDVLLFVATAKGNRRKVRLFLEQTFPSPAYMRERYNLQHTKLWPLAYFRRVGLMIRNLIERRR